METSIHSRLLGKTVRFWAPDSGGHIRVDMTGCYQQPGQLGQQICESGSFRGMTISTSSDEEEFRAKCRRWWHAYRIAQRAKVEEAA